MVYGRFIEGINPHKNKMKNTIKTRTVQLSYGTVKNASLKVPAGPASAWVIAQLIRESFLDYMFSRENVIFSDEVAVSSIGRSHFMAGALGGYETRLEAKGFALVKEMAESDMYMALDVVRYRNPGLSNADAYRMAAKNEAVSEETRSLFLEMARCYEMKPTMAL